MSRMAAAQIVLMVLAVGLAVAHAEDVVTAGQSMPRALKSLVSVDVFPYSSCNTNPALSPWRGKLIKLEDVTDGQLVTLNLFPESGITCKNGCSAFLLNLDILSGYSIVDAKIGSVSCPIVTLKVGDKLTHRFTGLDVPCSVGQAGRNLTFKIKGSTLAAIAGSSVNYVIYELATLLGLCPAGSFSSLLYINIADIVVVNVGK